MYQKQDIWLTYGRFNSLSGDYINYGAFVFNTRQYRKFGNWSTSHLKTFKKWLFDRIKDEDLRAEDGEYFRVVGDLALMHPMVEMAGKRHAKCSDKVLYVYNDKHPGGQFPQVHDRERKVIRSKRSVYELIDK